MTDFVFAILDLMWFPFTFFQLPLLVVPLGFGVFCSIFLIIKRLGRF